MLAMVNHSWGIKINNNIIRVRIEIMIVKELESTIFSTSNLTFSFFSSLLEEILPNKFKLFSSEFNLYSGLSKKICFTTAK